MPTYEYICEACSNEFEKFQQMSAAPIKKCPSCGKNKVQRKISVGGGIIFKGGGFYETDYRNEAYKKAAEADKPSETKGDAKSDAKSDSKGDAKPVEAKTDATPAAATDQPAKVEASKPTEPAATPAPQAKSSSAKSHSKPAKSKK